MSDETIIEKHDRHVGTDLNIGVNWERSHGHGDPANFFTVTVWVGNSKTLFAVAQSRKLDKGVAYALEDLAKAIKDQFR